MLYYKGKRKGSFLNKLHSKEEKTYILFFVMTRICGLSKLSFFKLFSKKKKSITCMNTLLKVLCAEGYHKSLLGWEEESQSIKLNQIYVKSFTVKIHLSLPFNPSDKQRSPRLMHREAPAAIKAFLKFLVLDSKLTPTWAEL